MELDLEGWKSRWVPKSVCIGFEQTWTSEAGETFDFAAMAEEEQVMAESVRAERIWLDQIATARAEFVAVAKADPASANYLAARLVELNETHGLGARSVPTDNVEAMANFWFLRELCKRDLFYLAKEVLGYDKLRFHLHKFMADSVQDVGAGYRGLREFPRDAYKTTVMGIAFCVQRILRDPDVKILYKMNAGDNAGLKVDEARNHFLKNERLRELFPEHVTTRVSDEGSSKRWRSPANRSPQGEATLTAAGVGSTKGGTSQHYDIILGDDFWSEKSVTSLEQTAKVKTDMAGIEYTLAEPSTGIILYIGTRFAHDDPTSELLEDPIYHCLIASGVTPNGRSLFPEALPIRTFVSQSRNTYVFSCQVMLNPTDESRGLDDKQVQFGDFAELEREATLGRARIRKVILADSSGDSKTTDDPIAVETWAIDHLGRCWMIDYVKEKMQPSEYVEELFRQFEKHRPEFIVRQKTLLDVTIQSFVNKRIRQRADKGLDNPRFYAYSLAKREKKMRITTALQPLLAEGKLWIDRNCPHRQEWLNELKDHPQSQNDDGLDAAAMLDDPAVSRIPSFTPPADAPVPVAHTEANVQARELTQRQAHARKMFEMARTRTAPRRASWRIG